jgi:hypothetical protein
MPSLTVRVLVGGIMSRSLELQGKDSYFYFLLYRLLELVSEVEFWMYLNALTSDMDVRISNTYIT